jgi:hypothetical protein
MPIYRVILSDGTEKSTEELEDLKLLFQSKVIGSDSLVQQENGSKWYPLGSLFNLSEWDQETRRYSVICSEGSEQQSIGISKLRELYNSRDINASSLVFDSVDNKWVPLSGRFDNHSWPQPPAPQANSKSESKTSHPEDQAQIGPEAAGAESVSQPEERTDVKATLHANEEDKIRRRWASGLLFATSAFWLGSLILSKTEGFLLPNESMITVAQVWNVIVAFGLMRGGDGWRAFACLRAGLGLPLAYYFVGGTEGRSSTYYGLFDAIWCIGFLVLLWGKTASSRRRIVGTSLVAGSQVAVLAVSLFTVIIPTYRFRSTVRSYSLPTKTVSDQDFGYAITIPIEWTVLKRDNPILNLPDAKMIAVNVRSGAVVAFLSEFASAGLRSPDNYLDQLEKNIKDQPSTHFRELRRTDILMDGSTWRKAEVEWQESGEELSGVLLVVRRGWLFYSLRGWSSKAFKDKAEEHLLDMQRAVKISPEEPNEKFNVGFIKDLQTNNPLISEQAGRKIVEAALERSYTVTELSQLVGTAVEKGRPGLTPAERNELEALYLRAFSTLSDAETRALRSYYDKLNAGQKLDPSEAHAAEMLILKGVRNLPESVQIQFRMVFSKMVESGLARLE